MPDTPLLTSFLDRVGFGLSDCWYWVGFVDPLGYGITGNRKRYGDTRAHRAAWRIFNGDIPAGLKVCHRCDVRRCVNPEHLFLGTQRENVHDMMNKGRARMGTPQPGELNAMARLTVETVEQIRREYAAGGISQKALAEKFGVTAMTVNRAVNLKSWRTGK